MRAEEPSATNAQEPSAASAGQPLTPGTQRELHTTPAWFPTNGGDTLPAAAGTQAAAAGAVRPGPLATAKPSEGPLATAKPSEGPPDAAVDAEHRALAGPPVNGPHDQSSALHPVVTGESTASSPTASQLPLLVVVAGVLALVGILACAIYDVVVARRRRVYVQHSGAGPGATGSPSPVPSTVGARRSSLPPMEPIHRHADVDEALHQFARPQHNRRAA
jgi:hypothetical protein